jgi:hypothetical protein
MRNRIIYANEGVLTGPAFQNGVTYANDIQSPNFTRIQSIDYDFTVDRNVTLSLGKKSVASYKNDGKLSVGLNLNYYSSSFNNESLLGFNVSDENGTFLGDALDRTDSDHYRKNFYLITADEGIDYNSNTDYAQLESVTYYTDCYLQSYSYELNVGSFPVSKVSYVGENAGFIQLSESATTSQPANIPILNKKNRNVLSNKSVNIPLGHDESYVYTSDFSAGLDGWGARDDNLSYGQTAGSVTDALKVNGSTNSASHDGYSSALLEIGKKYRITGKFYIGTGGGNYHGMMIYVGPGAISYLQPWHDTYSSYTSVSLGTWVDFDIEVVANSVYLYFYPLAAYSSGPPTNQFAASAADSFLIKDIVVTEVREMLLPSQATVQITTDSSLASGVLNLENDKINSFNLSLSVDREPVNLLGHKIPDDRRIKYPIEGEASFQMKCDDKTVGDLSSFMYEDARYNINATFKDDNNQILSIWDIKKAVFNSVSYSEGIGDSKTSDLNFSFDGLDIGVSGTI